MKRSFVLVLFLSLITVSIFSQQYIGKDKLYYGASYYPEGWDFKNIDQDIQRMKECSMNVMRMAEFSWALMEPTEGKYDFKWLIDVMDKLHANGIDVIIGTPTATPPAWLGEKYPEIYAIDENGIQATHGARRNCSYTNAKYREYSVKITEELAKAVGKHPALIGWQTDNEFNLNFDYSNETKAIWHNWLKTKFGTIDNLNKQWCTNLWSQSYLSFDQIPMGSTLIWHHPSLKFQWASFTNDMITEFQDIQLVVIRKYSKAPITHDGMPGQGVDYAKLFKNLDFMSVNNYHSFEAYDLIQSNYDRMRGYHKGSYWLFETAPNYSGGGNNGNTWFLHQPNGSLRAALWMNYAMGGQGAMFWLWRQHWAGQEMVHGSVISAWNKPAANYNEIKAIGAEISKFSDYLMHNPVEQAKVAIYWSHQNLLGMRYEEYANGLNYYSDWTYRFYRPIADKYIHRDVINEFTNISQYKVIMAPLMPYIPQNLRAQFKEWVNNGGILILGPMTGYRDENWASFTEAATGDIESWAGYSVESRIPIGTKIRDAEIPVMLQFANTTIDSSQAFLWSESLLTKGNVIATYKNGMHNGLPAIVENKVGKGKVVFLGTDPGKVAYGKIVENLAKENNILPLLTAEPGMVVVPRDGKTGKTMVIINISNKNNKLKLSKPLINIMDDKTIQNDYIVKPYEVLILKMN